jgi:hypothetical protein
MKIHRTERHPSLKYVNFACDILGTRAVQAVLDAAGRDPFATDKG